MNRRIKKKHIKQYLEFPNPDSILVFEVDMGKVDFIDALEYVQAASKNLLCNSVILPKGMQIKAMGKDEAVKYLTKILDFIQGDLS